MSSSQNKALAGVIGFFDEPHSLLEAARKVRDAKYAHFDCYTPFPVHGLDAAMGLSRSPIPFVTFAAGLTGCAIGFLFQYWTSAVDWPLVVGGKPFNSWPAFVPIMFELTVLIGGLSTVAAMFLFNSLPNVSRRAFDTSITRDRFALVIEAPAPGEDEDEEEAKPKTVGKAFQESEASQFLKSLGAKEVRSVYAEGWF